MPGEDCDVPAFRINDFALEVMEIPSSLENPGSVAPSGSPGRETVNSTGKTQEKEDLVQVHSGTRS